MTLIRGRSVGESDELLRDRAVREVGERAMAYRRRRRRLWWQRLVRWSTEVPPRLRM